MKLNDAIKWLVIAGLFGAFILSLAGVFVLLLVYIFNVTFYLHPVQVKFEADNQIYLVGLVTSTRTPFQPAPTFTATPTLQASFTPSLTLTPSATLTPPPTLTQTATFTPSPTFTFTPSPVPPTATHTPTQPPPSDPPAQTQIANIVGHGQLYTLDCEARSAVDLAAYFGVNIDEKDFLNHLPKSDDPDKGFVGNYWDPRGQLPPLSYGVYAGPVASLLRSYGLKASDHRNYSFEDIKKEIAAGNPVMIWVTSNTENGWGVSYKAPDGNTVVVAPYEHTVIVTGYDASSVTILDGYMLYQRTLKTFQNSWSVLGNMAVTISH